MNIALKPEQEQFIKSQIDRGRFKSADDAVLQAFKLLEEKYQDYESWIEDTRQKVDVAVAELDSAEPTLRERGEGVELDLVIDSLEERLRQRLQQKFQPSIIKLSLYQILVDERSRPNPRQSNGFTLESAGDVASTSTAAHSRTQTR